MLINENVTSWMALAATGCVLFFFGQFDVVRSSHCCQKFLLFVLKSRIVQTKGQRTSGCN